MLSNRQFEQTRSLALKLAGIELVERHRDLLRQRSHRIGILDSTGFDSLMNRAEAGETSALQQFLRLLTTKFTGFFRHASHFTLAAAHALEAAGQRGKARLWSAGASTGEEAYSLAMALIEVFGQEDPSASILATDIDEHALMRAQGGEFRQQALRGLSAERRSRFLLQSDSRESWGIAAAARKLVEFRVLNLAKPVWSVEAPFDVIFCRNVLMYLESSCRCRALERMASLLAPDGLLIQDPSEHLGKASHLFTPKGNAVYAARPKGALCPL